MSWYRTGSIGVTNGSTAVTGAGTAWITNAGIGEALLAPDGKLYEIANIGSDTTITLGSTYLGATQTGQAYVIVPSQSYIRDLAAQAAELVNNYSTFYNTIGQGKFPDGTVSAPSVTFSADINTGFYRSAADEVTLVANGVAIAKWGTTGFTILNSASVNIDGGTIDGTVIGGTTKAAGSFTALSASGLATASALKTSSTDASGATNHFDTTSTASANLGGSTSMIYLAGTQHINKVNGSVVTTTNASGLSVTGNLSSTGNTTLGDASTDTVQVNGYMGVGTAPVASQSVRIVPTALTGATQIGLVSAPVGSSASTSSVIGVMAQPQTAAAAFTTAYTMGVYVGDPIMGAGSIATNNYGIRVLNQTGGTSNYGIGSEVNSSTIAATITNVAVTSNVVTVTTSAAHGLMIGETPTVTATTNTGINGAALITAVPTTTTFTYAKTLGNITSVADTGTVALARNKWNIYASGSAPNYFAGNVGIGVTPSVWYSTYKAIQFSTNGSITANTDFAAFSNNAYTDAAAADRYLTTNYAGRYRHVASSGQHQWYTAPSGTAGDPITFGTPKMTLDATGNLGIGVTPSANWGTATKNLQISSCSIAAHASAIMVGDNVTADDAFANFKYINNAPAGFAYTVGSQFAWYGAASGTAGTAMPITKVLGVSLGNTLALQGANSSTGAGISFPATQVASSDANTLDDYEEGTWTPTITFATPGDVSVTYSVQSGRYTKIGNRVFYSCRVATSAFTYTTASGSLMIAGLPFLPATSQNRAQATMFYGWTKAGYSQIGSHIANADNNIYSQATGSGQALATVDTTFYASGSVVQAAISGHYEV